MTYTVVLLRLGVGNAIQSSTFFFSSHPPVLPSSLAEFVASFGGGGGTWFIAWRIGYARIMPLNKGILLQPRV